MSEQQTITVPVELWNAAIQYLEQDPRVRLYMQLMKTTVQHNIEQATQIKEEEEEDGEVAKEV